MTDDQQPPPPAADPFALKPPDLVQRQQLNILHYWSERAKVKAVEVGADGPVGPAASPINMPARWSLLRGVEPVIGLIRAAHPRVWTLGDYASETRTGPAAQLSNTFTS